MSEKRYRGWIFVINNYTEDDELIIFEMAQDAKYLVAGKEVGENGTPHYQGFVYFDTVKSFAQVKDYHSTCHWEYMKGTPEEAATYCKKDGDFYEEGEIPMSQKRKGDKGKEAIEERWALAKAGRFEELPPEQIKTYEYIYRKSLVVEDRNELTNIWIQGPSGCGKSSYVRETYPEFYTKPMSKWWDGYNGEDVVLLDDFDPNHGKYLSYFLKIWADHYAFNAEVKGGMLKIRPKVVIVTSQYTIDSCFESQEERDAISRRFSVREMGPPPAPFSNLFNRN